VSKELEFSKAERERLQGELAALAAKRTKLSDTSQLAGAEKALSDFNALEAAAITAWMDGGCVGQKPTPDIAKHGELEAKVSAAARAKANAGPALEAIAASEQDIRDRLEANRQDIANAAAHKMAAGYTELGKRAAALRTELRELEVQLEAAHFYWKNHADADYQTFRKRNPNFDAPHLAVTAALPLDPGGQYAMPEREAIKAHADEYAALQEG
jgi:hypothetical protein